MSPCNSKTDCRWFGRAHDRCRDGQNPKNTFRTETLQNTECLDNKLAHWNCKEYIYGNVPILEFWIMELFFHTPQLSFPMLQFTDTHAKD